MLNYAYIAMHAGRFVKCLIYCPTSFTEYGVNTSIDSQCVIDALIAVSISSIY